MTAAPIIRDISVTLVCPCGTEMELDDIANGAHTSVPCDDCGLRIGAQVSVDADTRSYS